jgi:hypothetical protein
MWEDRFNLKGGKWILRLKKQYSSKIWEDLVNNFFKKKILKKKF